MQQTPWILGLDIGTSSIGWAAVRAVRLADGELKPCGILDAGVRIFEAGLDDVEEGGRGVSRNAARRQARAGRRLRERRARRLARLFHLLQTNGLLPPSSGVPGSGRADRRAVARHEVMQRLYADLSESVRRRPLPPELRDVDPAVRLPYLLRALALHAPLEPFELGMVLYHLGGHRGFKSNRQLDRADGMGADAQRTEDLRQPPSRARSGGRGADAQRTEDLRKVLSEIRSLREEIAQSGKPTLGAYLATLSPPRARLRGRHTDRAMYEEEFERIWQAQAPHHPALGDPRFKAQVHRIIFHQRPLKSARHLIGTCELEPGRPRAPWSTWEAQRFRLLQRVNDLRVVDGDGKERLLTPDERRKLIDRLEEEGDLTCAQARRLLGLPPGWVFSIEQGGETRLPGNRVTAKLRDIFGADRWRQMSPEERRKVEHDVRSIQSEAALRRRGEKAWGLDGKALDRFATLAFEPGYCALSLRAIRKLLPELEAGTSYGEARPRIYRTAQAEAVDALPEVRTAFPALRNPLVTRALTEVRRVVNALVKEFGKPDAIRVELGRDIKRSARERKRLQEVAREREKERQRARQHLIEEMNIPYPTPRHVDKWLLAEECRYVCPYTGKSFNKRDLFDNPIVDVEHIVPFSRCLDDSFLNKTLCFVDENRNVKGNRTPFEAYGHDKERWDQILSRLDDWNADARTLRAKRARFLATTQDVERMMEEFTARQLTDTRYASRLALSYLGRLYGGEVDEGHRQRVYAGAGGATAWLRQTWGLNGILAAGGGAVAAADLDGGIPGPDDVARSTGGGRRIGKSREDHRHHAIDAICIALTEPRVIQGLADAAQRAAGQRRFDRMDPPWPGFREEVAQVVARILPSYHHRLPRTGRLHDDTFYSPPKRPDGKHHVRKPLADLTRPMVERIVDERIRKAVKEALGEGGKPDQVFKDEKRLPVVHRTRVRRVRIRVDDRAVPIGEGHRQRYVLTQGNRHMEIVEDDKGRWVGRIVSRLEAAERRRVGRPAVSREHLQGGRFLFSVARGDYLELRGDKLNGIFMVTKISEREVVVINPCDARLAKERQKAGAQHRLSISRLQESRAVKVHVDALGRRVGEVNPFVGRSGE